MENLKLLNSLLQYANDTFEDVMHHLNVEDEAKGKIRNALSILNGTMKTLIQKESLKNGK